MENPQWKTPATRQGEEFEMIAKTFQGLETVLATELIDLGANNIQIGRRMVSFTGDKRLLYQANFQLRTALRILMPIKHFRATSADEVYTAIQELDWTNYLTNDTTFAVDSVVNSQEFRHSKFVAYKVKDAIVDQMRERTGSRPNIRVTNPDLQLHIHITEYDCTLSLDSSGESLHRRGYRQETVEAPLNEVLAAGIIMLTGWKGECDLIDPMCGSGTIPIEAALIARGIAPGVYRKEYAFEKWPDFDQDLFDSIYEDESKEHDFEHHIYGYDINRNAVAIATTNVKAAGLSKEITIQQQDFADFTQPAEQAVIITNPPYGERISAPDLLGLYKMIGSKLKHQFVGGDAWVLSYREECFDQIGLKPSLRTPLYNGSLECELRKYQMFDGKFNDMRAGGGDIKTAQERRMMADRKRFKQHRDFKAGLEDDPRDRFTSRKEERDDRRRDFRHREDRKEFRREDRREFRHDDRHDDFKRGNDRRGPRRDERRDERRDFKRNDNRRDDRRKPFDRNKGNNKYGKNRFDDEE